MPLLTHNHPNNNLDINRDHSYSDMKIRKYINLLSGVQRLRVDNLYFMFEYLHNKNELI